MQKAQRVGHPRDHLWSGVTRENQGHRQECLCHKTQKKPKMPGFPIKTVGTATNQRKARRYKGKEEGVIGVRGGEVWEFPSRAKLGGNFRKR